MLRKLFLGFINIHILHHAAEEPVYGLWLIQELGQHGYKLSPGTLYPILHALEKEKFLKSHTKVIDRKIRKYYRATVKGKEMLRESKKKIQELIFEVLED